MIFTNKELRLSKCKMPMNPFLKVFFAKKFTLTV